MAIHRIRDGVGPASWTSKEVVIDGKCLAIFRVADCFFAVDGVCPHEGGPLAEGDLAGEVISCPWHGAPFNVRTGAVLGPPADEGLRTYQVEVDGGDLLIDPDPPAPS